VFVLVAPRKEDSRRNVDLIIRGQAWGVGLSSTLLDEVRVGILQIRSERLIDSGSL
jgi:hypothetical protein